MKIKIGPYKNWIGPYQIVDALFFWHERYPSDELEQRWDWVMDELIWTFEQCAMDDSTDQFFTYPTGKFDKFEDRIAAIKVDREGLDAHTARIKNGLRLFGKYYRGLWD
ncbi:hypothetical protein EB118_17110 [bacterium]|nr:hypothetical protein [bacterium]